jgi:hypothetical protein
MKNKLVYALFQSMFANQLKNMELEGIFSSEANAKKYADDTCGEKLKWDANSDGDGTPGAEVIRKHPEGGGNYKIIFFIEWYHLDTECLNKKSV